MPLTFPSHAAAVLPLCRAGGALPPSALIVGTCAPDFAYLFDTDRTNFHVFPGVVWPCVPLAFAIWVMFEVLILPSMKRWLPAWGGIEWGRLVTTRGLPTTPRGWLNAVFALGIGIASHILWDGFTHFHRAPAKWWYADVVVRVGGFEFAMPYVMQALSSVVGLVAVALVAAQRYRTLPALVTPSTSPVSLALPVIALGLLVAWGWLAATWGFERAMSQRGAWLIFWYLARGGLAGLVAASLLESYVSVRRSAAPGRS